MYVNDIEKFRSTVRKFLSRIHVLIYCGLSLSEKLVELVGTQDDIEPCRCIAFVIAVQVRQIRCERFVHLSCLITAVCVVHYDSITSSLLRD